MSSPIKFGAVYYRRSSPLEVDWERDYARAAEDGINMFRHWVNWSAVEIAPGKFNWEPYDRQAELAEKYGIKTIFAEMSEFAPEWFYAKYPKARRQNMNGRERMNQMNASTIVGDGQTMCMDNPEVLEGMGNFLNALGEHYKNCPSLYGYDVWNECTLYTPDLVCYCPGTQEKFRGWLKRKYGTLEALNAAWFRYSYTDWSQVQLPRCVGNYPEFFDAVQFQNENIEELFQFRVNTLRKADPFHKIVAHGNAKDQSDISPCCGDDWRFARNVDVYGYTFWYANQCSTVLGGDMIRSASAGKEFWRAEAIGDSTWEYRSDKTPYEPKKDEMSIPENIRLDAMMSFIAGAKGFLNPRYRGLMEGELFHAYGWYAPDGSRTDRSRMTAALAEWCHDPAQRGLWAANPIRGEVGLLLLEDSQTLCYSLYKNTDIYAKCLKGAYQAFLDSHIQSDVIRMSQIDDYDLLYVPYPLCLTDEAAERLKKWVEKGGHLISEGCFGFFNTRGHAFGEQPSRGLEALFGCVQKSVHLGPDKNVDLDILSDRGVIRAGVYRQSYTADGAEVLGTFENGDAAIVSHKFGKGCTILVGSMPGYGYFNRPDESTRRWFASLLPLCGKTPAFRLPFNTGIVGRLWKNGSETYLWLLNMTTCRQSVPVELSFDIECADALRCGPALQTGAKSLVAEVDGRDAAVIRIS